jgi:hypothetical protein
VPSAAQLNHPLRLSQHKAIIVYAARLRFVRFVFRPLWLLRLECVPPAPLLALLPQLLLMHPFFELFVRNPTTESDCSNDQRCRDFNTPAAGRCMPWAKRQWI